MVVLCRVPFEIYQRRFDKIVAYVIPVFNDTVDLRFQLFKRERLFKIYISATIQAVDFCRRICFCRKQNANMLHSPLSCHTIPNHPFLAS